MRTRVSDDLLDQPLVGLAMHYRAHIKDGDPRDQLRRLLAEQYTSNAIRGDPVQDESVHSE
jgi:hypothetical protein